MGSSNTPAKSTETLPPIRSPRLILRPFLPSDFEQVHAYSSDPEVVKFMQWGPNTEEQTRQFMETCFANQKEEPRLTYDFAVVMADTAEFVGSVSLRLGKKDSMIGDVGYCYSRQAWGKGYASEAAEAVVRFAFDQLGLQKVGATCDPLNFGSAKVLQKAGMKLEGFLRKHINMKGKWRDTLLFGCAKQDIEQNLAELNLCQRRLSPGEPKAQPLKEFEEVTVTHLTELFACGSLDKISMKAGALISAHTHVLEESAFIISGRLQSGEDDKQKIYEQGSIVYTPGAVRQGPHLALTDVELLIMRNGPIGEFE